ncbi:MAG TPA: THUMP domain-containing protein [Candidatus Nanoarchaeia archaeon]|nr:THUMP domain-containing protein [Candidatus Nanoarchaeia archaeon]
MKALAITSKGMEDVCAQEINELISVKTAIKPTVVLFDVKEIKDLCLLCYKSQSVSKILLLFGHCSSKDIQNIKEPLQKAPLQDWFAGKSFRVSSEVIGAEQSTAEINEEVGGFILEKTDAKVDLTNPDVILFVYVYEKNCYFGIDFAGFSLHKRSYKIFPHQRSLRGTIAYALVCWSGFGAGKTLLDPFVSDGVITIEAALYASNKAVNFYQKEKFAFNKFIKYDFGAEDSLTSGAHIMGLDTSWLCVNSSKKNAKIAGINKLISLSRVDVDWLDVKFDESSIDCIVSYPPQCSKQSDIKHLEKVYDKLFYQAEYILRKNGSMVLVTKKTELLKQCAEKYHFKLKEERVIHSGKDELIVLIF